MKLLVLLNHTGDLADFVMKRADKISDWCDDRADKWFDKEYEQELTPFGIFASLGYFFVGFYWMIMAMMAAMALLGLLMLAGSASLIAIIMVLPGAIAYQVLDAITQMSSVELDNAATAVAIATPLTLVVAAWLAWSVRYYARKALVWRESVGRSVKS